jgi:NAD(P)-dependent dehydrogenase (short-subunit alcohol dehydrogenase family)
MPILSGKTALITGALGTIGLAMVRRYAEEGAEVIALDLPNADAESLLAGHAEGARFVASDLDDLAAAEATAREVADEAGGIDILVNNAAYVVHKPYDEFSIAEYERHIRINSSAAFVLSRAVSGHMRRKSYGKIVNLTSLTLTGNWEHFVPYVASKGAMYGLIKSLARDLGQFGIRVNGISPGAVVSDAEWRNFGDRREAYHQWILERQSIKQRIDPTDIANLAVFLSSPQSDLISGQNIRVDGGW